jgi:hypothetical protein
MCCVFVRDSWKCKLCKGKEEGEGWREEEG